MKRRMKKFLMAVLIPALAIALTSCGKGSASKSVTDDSEFTPRLDTNTDCSVTVAGHYNNFEALEAEFNEFSQYYPNVRLTYTFMDGYSKAGSGILSTALSGSEARIFSLPTPGCVTGKTGTSFLLWLKTLQTLHLT